MKELSWIIGHPTEWFNMEETPFSHTHMLEFSAQNPLGGDLSFRKQKQKTKKIEVKEWATRICINVYSKEAVQKPGFRSRPW